jgi:hypothetical protein
MLLLRNNRKNRVIWKKKTKTTLIESGGFFGSMIRNDLSEFDITGSTLYINRTTAVLKIEKFIISSMTASLIGCAVVLYTDISCLGGVFAKNTSRETKNFPSQMSREI